jgi:hypothetical protein
MDVDNQNIVVNERASKYEDMLKKAGFDIIGLWDDVIFFKLIGYAYSLHFDDKAPEYLSFTLGSSIDKSKQTDDKVRYEIVQFINSKYKYIKCTFEIDDEGDESVQFVCDLMYVSELDFKNCVRKVVQALDNAYISTTAKYPDFV